MAVADGIVLSAPPRDARRGVVLMTTGIALFSMLNGVVKAQAELFPLNQIIFFRNAFAMIPILLMVQAAGGVAILRTRRLGEHVALSALFTATLFSFFLAYSLMPLADATAIAFTQPLIVTLLSLPFAAEKVRRIEWIAVAVGFAGVMLVVQPSGDSVGVGAVFALLGSAASATTMLIQRRLSGTEATHAITFYTLGLSAVVMVPTLAFSWVMPTPWQLAGLIVMGLASGLCQYLVVRAFYHAAASTVAPVTYTKMVWAILIGVVWFGDVPEPIVIVGSIIVIGATLLVARADRPAAAVSKPAP